MTLYVYCMCECVCAFVQVWKVKLSKHPFIKEPMRSQQRFLSLFLDITQAHRLFEAPCTSLTLWTVSVLKTRFRIVQVYLNSTLIVIGYWSVRPKLKVPYCAKWDFYAFFDHKACPGAVWVLWKYKNIPSTEECTEPNRRNCLWLSHQDFCTLLMSQL